MVELLALIFTVRKEEKTRIMKVLGVENVARFFLGVIFSQQKLLGNFHCHHEF
jgi:hypothetical protein